MPVPFADQFKSGLQKRTDEYQQWQQQGGGPPELAGPIVPVYTAENYQPGPSIVNVPEQQPDEWIPPSWDYQTAEFGPRNEKLPEGALSWNPQGEPYYGDGLQGWWKGTVARLTADIDRPDNLIPEEGSWWQKALGTVSNLAQYFQNVGGEEGGAPSPLTYATRAASAVVGGGLEALAEPARKTEQVLNVLTEGVEEMGAGSPIAAPAPVQVPEFMQPWAEQNQWFVNMVEFMAKLSPANLRYHIPNIARALTGPLSLDEKLDIAEQAYQSGRVLYSGIYDETIKEEYKRRLNAGENPYLLALELQNPVAEMVGQLPLDPLNAVGLLGKGAREAKRILTIQDDFFKVSDEIGEVLKLGEAADDIKAAGMVQNAVQAQIVASGKTAQGLTAMAQKTGLFSYTNEAKRFVVNQRVGELGDWIARNAADPDDTIEQFVALAKRASGKEDDVAHGLAVARNFVEPRPLLSEAGNELGVILNRMLADETGAVNYEKFLNGLQKAQETGVDGLIKHIDNLTENAIKGMFPTIREQVKLGMAVPPHYRALSAFDDILQRNIYRPLNSIFAGIYMGLSPGYAVRNFLTNTLHIAVDEGPGALSSFKSSTWIDRTKLWLGGQLPEGVAGFGKGTQGVDVANVSRRLPMTALAEKMETSGAAMVVGKTVDDFMRKALQPGRAIPDVRPLLDAGMSPETARALTNALLDNYGDVPAALKAFRDTVANGVYERFRSLDMFSDADRNVLRAFGLSDEVLESLRRAGSQDEAIAALRKTLDDQLQYASRTANEGGAVAANSEEAVESLGHMNQAGVFSDEELRLGANFFEANTQATDALVESFHDAMNEAAIRAGADPAALAQAQMARVQGTQLLRERTRAWARINTQLNTSTWAWNDNLFKDRRLPSELWRAIGLPGEPPLGLTKEALKDALWKQKYYPPQRQNWAQYRDELDQITNQLVTQTGVEAAAIPSTQRAQQLLEYSRKWDNVLGEREVARDLNAALTRGDNATSARIYARQFGISSVSETGIPHDQKVLNAINANLPEGVEKFDNLTNVPPEVAQQALLKHAGLEITPETVAPVPYAGGAPSYARVLTEQEDGLRNLFANLERKVTETWGKVDSVAVNPSVEKALQTWEKTAGQRVAEARLIAGQLGNAAREFTLLSYPKKKVFDLALAYVYPYHFWYTRTYSNWLKRIVTNPEVLGAYARYKDTLAKLHAGAPEWWKYNINTNELFGLDSENPLFFNLEATLNPLNGLTGIDFNDPQKRVNWWTALLDDMGKFGPSTWTPYSLATAAALYLRGEDEAAARWGGRLIPQTAAVKSLTHLLNIGPPGGLELDPNVHFFSGGLDPYERRRVGRAIGTLIEEGELDNATGIDAAYNQTGPAWDMAMQRSADGRSLGNLFSFFAGVGFKGRNAADIQIDQFYEEYYNLWALEDNLSPDEFRGQMDSLRTRYPFMDAVLLSRKAGPARDRSYAYNVLGRIPPGQSGDITEAVGLDDRLISRFWDEKGHIENWSESDQKRFMAAIVDVGAILNMPDDATRTKWSEAKQRYGTLNDSMTERYGEDIMDRIDHYFAALRESTDQASRDAAYALLENDPLLDEALKYKDFVVLNDRLLAQYYGSIETVERFYEGYMWDAIHEKVGSDIHDLWDEYYALKESGGPYRDFYKANEQRFNEYRDLKAYWDKIIAQEIADAAKALPEGDPLELRDYEAQSVGQEDLLAGIQVEQSGTPTPYTYTWQDWQAQLSAPVQNVLLDFVYAGEELPAAAQDQLEALAEQTGMDYNVMLQLMENSINGIPGTNMLGSGGTNKAPGSSPYSIETDTMLTDKTKEYLTRTTRYTGTPTLERDGMKRLAYAGQLPLGERLRTHQTQYYMTSNQNDWSQARHELAHLLDDRDNISEEPGFWTAIEKWKDDDGRVLNAYTYATTYGNVATYKTEAYAALFAEFAQSPDEIPYDLRHYFSPYLNLSEGRFTKPSQTQFTP